jgi:hypothetical protein
VHEQDAALLDSERTELARDLGSAGPTLCHLVIQHAYSCSHSSCAVVADELVWIALRRDRRRRVQARSNLRSGCMTLPLRPKPLTAERLGPRLQAIAPVRGA